MDEYVQNFASQFEETEAKLFTPGTKFRELDEWSSLMALNIIAMTDEVYGVKLKGVDIRSAVSIEDLYHIVKSRLQVN